jgi:thiamine biosynthesis lipoprotein
VAEIRPVVSTRTGPAAGVSFTALGTRVSVLVTEPGDIAAADALLRAELAAVDAACSRFRADSELSRLNAAGGQETRISTRLAGALAAALEVAEATGGDVDPTCGRSLITLGYDRDFAELPPPPPGGAAAGGLAGLVGHPAAGWRRVSLDVPRGTATVPDGVLLDLGATAKALAADQAAARIAAELGCGVLVNLGGDIRVDGPPPAGGWRVGITEDTTGEPGHSDQVVVLRAGGLATSGTRIRAWRRGAAAVHHIVVPGTGLPARTCWRTVTVAAASCVAANAASTAAVIRGERAPGWLRRLGLPSRLVRQDGQVLAVAGWPAPGAGPAARAAGGRP